MCGIEMGVIDLCRGLLEPELLLKLTSLLRASPLSCFNAISCARLLYLLTYRSSVLSNFTFS